MEVRVAANLCGILRLKLELLQSVAATFFCPCFVVFLQLSLDNNHSEALRSRRTDDFKMTKHY